MKKKNVILNLDVIFNLEEGRGRKQEDDTDCITHVDPTETTSFITKGE